MTYTVHWLPEAEEELAAIWAQAADRQVSTDAADAIDQQLQREPYGQSESRDLDRRILLVSPLGVLFKVIPDGNIIYVLTVWRFETT